MLRQRDYVVGVAMARILLSVPFAEKDDVKRLGARWDTEARSWFVPDGVALEGFSRWLPPTPAWNVRSKRYWIVSGETLCWKCQQPTSVHAIALPPGHETLVEADEDEDEDADDEWEAHDFLQFLLYVDDLDSAVIVRLRQRCPHWKSDYSQATDSSYWMNHCRQCGMRQGDHHLHSEPGAPFFPTTDAQLRQLIFNRIDEQLFAFASTNFSTFLLDYDGVQA